MVEVYRCELTKEKLAAMPASERRVLLLLGHAANEINILNKLLLMSKPPVPFKGDCINKVSVGQCFMILRVLIGKLFEAHLLFGKRFQGDGHIRVKYMPHLNDEAKKALEYLNDNFGTKSFLGLIRDNLSFHYYDKHDLIEKGFKYTSNDESLEFVFSKTRANTFYAVSELVVCNAIIKIVDKRENGAEPYHERVSVALDKLMSITTETADNTLILFNQCIHDIVERNFLDIQVRREIIEGAPPLSQIRIPFFVDPDAAPEEHEGAPA